ncbi:hypothetical protein BDW74DRAFT_183812 [Aspergillus multicolor]|uniref:uncharacterized protein n=1 Tax=Aspergillus multicolor TaxID=41759 RepID=UPI003CCE3365
MTVWGELPTLEVEQILLEQEDNSEDGFDGYDNIENGEDEDELTRVHEFYRSQHDVIVLVRNEVGNWGPLPDLLQKLSGLKDFHYLDERGDIDPHEFALATSPELTRIMITVSRTYGLEGVEFNGEALFELLKLAPNLKDIHIVRQYPQFNSVCRVMRELAQNFPPWPGFFVDNDQRDPLDPHDDYEDDAQGLWDQAAATFIASISGQLTSIHLSTGSIGGIETNPYLDRRAPPTTIGRLKQIGKNCPNLRELRIPVRRQKGAMEEVEIYKTFGTCFPHLETLWLRLDSVPESEDILSDNDTRDLFVNIAVDESLARNILDIDRGSSSQPSALRLLHIEHGRSTGIPRGLGEILDRMEFRWKCFRLFEQGVERTIVQRVKAKNKEYGSRRAGWSWENMSPSSGGSGRGIVGAGRLIGGVFLLRRFKTTRFKINIYDLGASWL